MRRITGAGLALIVAASSGCGAPQEGFRDDDLGVMIDTLLPRIADASGLEVLRPVVFAMQPKAEMRAFIEEQLDAQLGGEQLRGMERAYRALGLLPADLDLRSLLLELYTEQVVGYYDPRTDRLYVVEGADASTAAPVVAHELVHALQDQHTDLEALVIAERGNDRQMAAQAAAEGQAMLVMLALQAAQASGQRIDPGSLPDLGPMMRPALEAENAQFPVFRQAPRLIRETLIFPYIGGATFVQALYRHVDGVGPPVPFGDLLPQSTEQVLHPRRAFLDDRDAPTEVRLGEPGPGWSLVYSNTLGELETGILLSERSGDPDASAAGWDGDRYALLQGPSGAEVVVWYSVWDDEASADRVAALLRSSGGNLQVERISFSGRPVVRVLIARGGAVPGEDGIPALESMEEVAVR